LSNKLIGIGIGFVLLALVAGGCSSSGDTYGETITDHGVTTLPTVPPSSAPALPSGITADQIRMVVAGYSDLGTYSGISTSDVDVQDHQTFEDWAAAKLHIQGHGSTLAVFVKRDGAWHLRALDVKDAGHLRGIDAPDEVFRYFGM
jgi:hypothetical protein